MRVEVHPGIKKTVITDPETQQPVFAEQAVKIIGERIIQFLSDDEMCHLVAHRVAVGMLELREDFGSQDKDENDPNYEEYYEVQTSVYTKALAYAIDKESRVVI